MACLKRVLLVSLFFLLPSCGYRLGEGRAIQATSFSLDFIQGDTYGFLTKELIDRLQNQMQLRFQNHKGDLQLEIVVCEPKERMIGFTRTEKKDEKTTRIVASDEARLSQVATICLYLDNCSIGPIKVEASIDFDFESDFSIEGEDQFSLGQLKMYNQAKQTALIALAKEMAEKVVDSLLRYW